MHIRKYSSTLGRPTDKPQILEFGPKTVIQGLTRSGKSLVQQSLRTAFHWPRPKTAAHAFVHELTDSLHPSASSGTIELGFAPRPGANVGEDMLRVEWQRGKTPTWLAGGSFNLEDEAFFSQVLVADRARTVFELSTKQRYQYWASRYVDPGDIDLSPPTVAGDRGIQAWNEALEAAQKKSAHPIATLSAMVGIFTGAQKIRTSNRKKAEERIRELGVGQTAPDLLDAIDAQLAEAQAWEKHSVDRARAKQLHESLASLIGQVQEARESQQLLQDQLDQIVAKEAAEQETQLSSTAAARDRLNAEILRLQQQGQLKQSRTVELQVSVESIEKKLSELEQTYVGVVAQDHDCFACRRANPDYSIYRAELQAKRAENVAEWQQIYTEIQEIMPELATTQAALRQLGASTGAINKNPETLKIEADLASASRNVAQLEGAVTIAKARLEELLAQIERAGAHRPYDGPPVSEMMERREAALKYRDRLIQRNALDASIHEAQRDRELYKLLRASAAARLKNVSDTIRSGLLGEMGALLPSGVRIEVDPESSEPLQLLTPDLESYTATQACGFERLALVTANAQTLASDAPWSLALFDTVDINEAGEKASEMVKLIGSAVDIGIFRQTVITTHRLDAWGSAEEAERAGWTVVRLSSGY